MDNKLLASNWSSAMDRNPVDDMTKWEELANRSVSSITHKLSVEVAETEDEIMFRTISNFAQNNYQISVEKDELVKAIQLIRWSKEYGQSIDERWSTASQQAEALADAYRRGLEDGIEKEHTRILDALSEKGE